MHCGVLRSAAHRHLAKSPKMQMASNARGAGDQRASHARDEPHVSNLDIAGLEEIGNVDEVRRNVRATLENGHVYCNSHSFPRGFERLDIPFRHRARHLRRNITLRLEECYSLKIRWNQIER